MSEPVTTTSPTAAVPLDSRHAAALLTLNDVAGILRISRRQVHRLLAAGRLPPADVNLGFGSRGRRWIHSRLLAWCEAGCPLADAWRACEGRRPG